MNRLTEKTKQGYAIKLNNPKNEQEARKQLMKMFAVVVNKLAAYEDTGLEPEEVADAYNEIKEKNEFLAEIFEENIKLKELLKKAVEDMTDYPCNVCVNTNSQQCDVCIRGSFFSRSIKWRYADEVEEVLKDE